MNRGFFLFLTFLFFSPVDLFSDSNNIDYLINQSINFIKKNEYDSLDYTLNKLVPQVVGNELDSLLKLRQISMQISLENQINKSNVIRAKSQTQSIILLLICLSSFVYLIYYTDKKSRDKQVKKIRAANKISKYESNIRKRISEKLHDDIGGSIIALKMKCLNKEGMENELKVIDDIYNQIRGLSSDLDMQNKFSQTLENGIDILVSEMCNTFSKTTVNVFPQNINEIDNSELIGDILMTTKELITNVIKHSKADEISIDVSLIENFINIIVQDNGVGLDKSKSWGQGLKSINNRAIIREGLIDVDSNNSGTTVSVKFLRLD